MTIYNVLAGPRNTSSGELLYSANKRRTLMFIGDSITWGFGVNQNQAFPALVQTQADTRSNTAVNTALWTARNVQADDIAIGRDTVPPWNIPFKLTNGTSPVSTPTYDNQGPFASSFSSTISATGPAIIFDGLNDGFTVTPTSSCQFLTVMVKVTGTNGQTASLSAFNDLGNEIPDVSSGVPLMPATATVGTQNLVPTAPNVYRFIYQSPAASAGFVFRRVDSNAAVAVRVLSVNPTNAYPTSNYVQVQINARGSYTASDYISNISSIMETVIHPQNESTSGYTNDYPAFVLSVGTVSMYTSQATVTNATGNGSTATLTYTASPALSFPIGTQISVSGVVPSAYNGVFTVTNSTSTTVSYASTATGYTSGGTVINSTYDRRVGPSEYRGNLNSLVNAIKAASPNSPIFLTHPPIATSPWVLSDGATRSQYDAEIQSLAISQNLPVIDLRSALTAGDYSDGIHPTAAGQVKLAAVYNAALRF